MSTDKLIMKKSLIVACIMAVSTLLGLVRESSIAYMFGATGYTDAYFVAIIIPGMFTGTIGGALKNTFVTIYSGYLAHNEQAKAWHTANSLISVMIILLVLLLGLLMFFAPGLIGFVAPSYYGEKFTLAVNLARIVMPTLFFGCLLGIFVGMNNSHNSFTAPSSVGLAANVVQVISIYLLGKLWGIYGLAVGFAFGVLAQLLIQMPFVRKHGFRFKFKLDVKDQGIREIAVPALAAYSLP